MYSYSNGTYFTFARIDSDDKITRCRAHHDIMVSHHIMLLTRIVNSRSTYINYIFSAQNHHVQIFRKEKTAAIPDAGRLAQGNQQNQRPPETDRCPAFRLALWQQGQDPRVPAKEGDFQPDWHGSVGNEIGGSWLLPSCSSTALGLVLESPRTPYKMGPGVVQLSYFN